MWAGSLLLRIGEHRDLLVAVQADTDRALDRLRTLFEPWIEPELPEHRPDARPVARPAFSVRLEPVRGNREGRTSGPRPVPQLRYGSRVIARSRRPDDIVYALALQLGGAHRQRNDDGRLWLGLRPFAEGDSAVLLDADHPTLVNDRRLADVGIEELAAWSVMVEPDHRISVPPPLPDLAWEAAGLEPPPQEWRSFTLDGIVSLHDRKGDPCRQVEQPPEDQLEQDPDEQRHTEPDETQSTTELTAALAALSLQTRWAELVRSLAGAGSVVEAADHASLRGHIRTLLDGISRHTP